MNWNQSNLNKDTERSRGDLPAWPRPGENMIRFEVIASALTEWDLLEKVKDVYENPHLNLYMGYVVDMETGEVFPGNLRLNKGKYEVFKVVAD